MRKIVVALFAVVVIAVLAGLAFLSYQSHPPTVTVEMRLGEGTVDYGGSQVPNYLFSPAMITIKQGTTVTWINKDPNASHTITTNEMSAAGTPTDMGTVSPNGQWSYTFNVGPGTYHYYCRDHPWMSGIVIVTS
jgi:plastocyanin